MRILCAEDHKGMREAYKEYLVKKGHEVHAFENGLKAYEYLTQNPVDLLLTDNRMPVMSGLELIKKTRELMNPKTQNIKVRKCELCNIQTSHFHHFYPLIITQQYNICR